MKRMFQLALLVCLITAFACAGYAQETIRLASGEWPPYQSKFFKYAGVVSRIVTEAFASEGVRVEYGYFPWKRAYHYAESGQWDGTFVWFSTPERKKLFLVSDPVIDIRVVFFYLKDFSFDWTAIDDLKPLIVGATLGYDYGTAFQDAEKDRRLRVVRKEDDKTNLKRLLDGQINIFPCDVEVGYELLQKHFSAEEAQRFTHHPLPVKAAPHHLLLSNKIERNKRMLTLFNRGLKRMKENGRFEQYIMESRRGDYRP